MDDECIDEPTEDESLDKLTVTIQDLNTTRPRLLTRRPLWTGLSYP
jgi:hypothetical protein